MAMTGAGWAATVGGLLAIIGQFWGANFYLPLLGGIVAIVGGYMSKK